MSVMAPLAVPFSFTFAPIISKLDSSNTVPVTVFCAHTKSEQHISINVLMHLLHLFSLVSLFIITNLRIRNRFIKNTRCKLSK